MRTIFCVLATLMLGLTSLQAQSLKAIKLNAPDKTRGASVHIPADTRSAFPVISVQSPVSIQCCWQS